MGGTQFGIPPKNIASLDYTGADLALVPVQEAQRDPTVNDKNYPIDCFWRNSVTRKLWWLSGFDSTGALWIPFTGGSSAPLIDFLGGNASTGTFPVVPDNLGNVTVGSALGTIVITGSTNTLNFDLAGGGVAIEKINVDTFTGPGTNPVVPSAGAITVTGAQVSAGTVGANVIRTDSLAANTYTIQIQRSTSNATADSTKNGVSHFNNGAGQFTVDSNGFVSLNGTGVLSWVNQTTTPFTVLKGNAYQCNSASQIVLTLPIVGNTFGDTIRVQGFGSGGWVLNAGAGQTIQVQSMATSVAGSVTSTNQYNYIEVVCSSTTTTWFATVIGGNLTIA